MYIRNIALSLMLLVLFCRPTAAFAAGESDIVRILAVGNSFVPAGLSRELALMAQKAAHAACINPMQPSR